MKGCDEQPRFFLLLNFSRLMGSIPKLNFDDAILKQYDGLLTSASILIEKAGAENSSIKSR